MAETKKAGREVIYLDVDDDITTVIDKVDGAKDKVVALVLPKRFATLQSIVNMRLLKRSAEGASKNLVLVTTEQALLPLAGASGIHVAKNLHSAPEIPSSPIEESKPTSDTDHDAEADPDSSKLDYHRSIGVLAAAEMIDDPETVPLDDGDTEETDKKEPETAKKPKSKKNNVPNFERFRNRMFLGAAGGVLLIVFLILAIFVWPQATITLATEATPISANFDMTATNDAEKLDLKKAVIPAEVKTSDLKKEQSVDATGEKNNGKKASGAISMTAKKCSGNPFDFPGEVPAGAGVSSGGNYYITQSKTTFTGSGISGGCYTYTATSDTPITAQSAGTKYNVSSGTFSVVGRSDVSATGSASGGTDDIETVVSQDDVNAVASKITEEDKKEFADKFRKDLDEAGLYPIEGTFKEKKAAVSSSPAVGQPASSANVTVTITYSVLAVSKEDLQKAVTEELNKEIDKSKQKIGTDDVLEGVSVDVKSQKSSSAEINITQDTTAVPVLDEASIKTQIAGKKSGEIKDMLETYPGVKSVEVDFSPFWVSKAPKKPEKITIVQKQIKTTEESGSSGNTSP